MMMVIKIRVLMGFAVLAMVSLLSTSAVEVGETICVEGFIMDLFCIERGTLLDNRSVRTLEGPDQHSVHCLVDVRQCVNSDFEVLLDPDVMGSGAMYARGWRLNDDGKDMIVAAARNVGRCSTCEGGGSLGRGFRAAVTGVVQNLGSGDTPPLIEVTGIQPTAGEGAVDKATACSEVNGSDDPIMPPNMILSAGSINDDFYLHGALMLVGWGFLLPVGAIIGKLFKHRPNGLWYQIHRVCQMVGLIISAGGYFFAIHHFDAFADVGDPTTLNYEHAVLGSVTMALGLFQPINAVLRPHAPAEGEEKTSLRFAWEIVHKGLGWISLILAAVNIGMGTTLLSEPDDQRTFQRAYGFGAGASFIVLIAALVWDKQTYKPLQQSGDDKQVQDEEDAVVPPMN